MIAPAWTIMILGSVGTFADIMPVSQLTPFDSMTRLTLDGALVLAVGVLWKALAAKDVQIMAMATKVTETMVLTLEGVKEARKASEEIGAALDNLAENIAALPCAMNESVTEKAERADAARRHGVRSGQA